MSAQEFRFFFVSIRRYGTVTHNACVTAGYNFEIRGGGGVEYMEDISSTPYVIR
jgi:hypothetical protein